MSAVKQTKLTTNKLGGSSEAKIFSSEHLTPKNQKIVAQAKRLKDRYFIWTKGGNIM